MPRKYIKKGVYQNYSHEDMEKAVQAVREGLSLGKASKAFKVPKSTLSDRISKRVLPEAPALSSSSLASETRRRTYFQSGKCRGNGFRREQTSAPGENWQIGE